MRIFALLSSVSILLCISFTAHAQTDSQRRLEAHVRFLANDLLRGRGTPSHDLDVSALYLANQLRADGWQPASGDCCYQTYMLKSFSAQQARYHISINGFKLDSKDVVFLPFGMDPANTPAKYDLVFAGHGVFAPERDVDDFDGADLRGKAVVAMLGASWELDPQAVHAYDRAVGKSVHVTVRNGSFLIYVSEAPRHTNGDGPAQPRQAQSARQKARRVQRTRRGAHHHDRRRRVEIGIMGYAATSRTFLA